MKYIDKKDWKKLLAAFYKKKKKEEVSEVNKGIQFESLVQSLLCIMFEESDLIFQPTKASHDGSKDFWAIDEEDALWWAECKNYTSNISLTQLAPTLIMAELNNIQYLLFFSFSKLNDSLKRRIGQYSYEHQKEVFIYEDELLEELLFENLKEELFSALALNSNISFYPKHNMDIIFFNEKNPNQLDKKNFNGYYEIKTLSVGEIYNLNVLFVNNSQPKKVKISVKETEDILYFEFFDSNKNKTDCVKQKILELKPNQLKMSKFVVRLVKYKEQIFLPKLIVEVLDNKTFSESYFSPIAKYNCIWNRKDVFIGKNYENVLFKFESTCINKNQISGFIVYGSGGTGKTRTIEECTAVLLKNEYQVLNFIGFDSNSSWKDVVREIVYSAFAISEDLKMDLICNIDYIVTPLIQDKEKEAMVSLLKLLDTTTFCMELLQNYFSILFEKLRKGKYAIVVDNLQSYSIEILSFFEMMIQYLLQCQGSTKLILLFSVNTALVFEHKYFSFLSEFDRTNFATENIEGFQTEKQAIVFLKTILKLDDYPLNYPILKKVLSRASKKPKYIEQVANYLIQKECIELKNGKGIISDSDYLEKELQNIPKSFETLFISTYQLLVKKYSHNESDFKKIISLLYLFCELDENTLNFFHINKKAIQVLYDHNILVNIGNSSNNIFRFEHDLVEQCFFKKIYLDLLEVAMENFLEVAFYDNYLSSNKRVQYILSGLYGKRFTNTQLSKINKEIPTLDIPNKFLFKFYFYFMNNMVFYKEYYSIDVFIGETLHCCKYVRDHVSEVEAEKIFDLVFPHIFEMQLYNEDVIEKHFSFVIHYCENKCRLKEISSAIRTYKEYYHKLSCLLITLPELKNKFLYAQAYVDNRIFVCGKLEGKPEKYLNNLKYSIKISSKHKFWDILFENYFDASNIYFFKEVSMDKGIRLLERGFICFYKMSPELIRKFKVNLYSKMILYNLIRKEYQLALDKVKEALEYIENNKDINYHLFFKCRYLKYKIICLMLLNQIDCFLDNTFEDYEKIIQIINKKDDLERLFLQAKYAFFIKNAENFSVIFEHYYCMVSHEIKDDNSYARDIRMLEDLAIKYRMLFSPDTFYLINNRAKPLFHINRILQMDNAEFQKFSAVYKSSAPIVDKSGKDGYFI